MGKLTPVVFLRVIYKRLQMLTDADYSISGVASVADARSVAGRCSSALCLGRTTTVAGLASVDS